MSANHTQRTSRSCALRKADADWKHLLELLKANRMTDFGETSVTRLELIFGDWYASANTVRTLQEYVFKA